MASRFGKWLEREKVDMTVAEGGGLKPSAAVGGLLYDSRGSGPVDGRVYVCGGTVPHHEHGFAFRIPLTDGPRSRYGLMRNPPTSP